MRVLTQAGRLASEGSRRVRHRARVAMIYLSYGVAATVAAGAGSLLVNGTTTRRVMWVIAGLSFSVVAGVAHALSHPPSTHGPASDHLSASTPALPPAKPDGAPGYLSARARQVPSPR